MLVKNWEDLSKIPKESKTHILKVDVDGCNAWLIAKDHSGYKKKLSIMRNAKYRNFYLSTHTFYGDNYKLSTKILKVCGFDVEIDNWDKQ